MSDTALIAAIRECTICAPRFLQSATAHAPRPVTWFAPALAPRILIAGQAPGARVHASGRPFTDPSGERLRDWMGIDAAQFYDQSQIAIVPMAFCFPGYDAKGADLPPPAICARSWRSAVMARLPDIRLTLLVGGAAIRWHLGLKNVTEAVRLWREHEPHGVFPLPHPSWRNTGWLKRNPWFEAETLPVLRARLRQELKQ